MLSAGGKRRELYVACVGDACLTSIYRRRDDNDYYVGLRLRYRVIEFYWRPIRIGKVKNLRSTAIDNASVSFDFSSQISLLFVADVTLAAFFLRFIPGKEKIILFANLNF